MRNKNTSNFKLSDDPKSLKVQAKLMSSGRSWVKDRPIQSQIGRATSPISSLFDRKKNSKVELIDQGLKQLDLVSSQKT